MMPVSPFPALPAFADAPASPSIAPAHQTSAEKLPPCGPPLRSTSSHPQELLPYHPKFESPVYAPQIPLPPVRQRVPELWDTAMVWCRYTLHFFHECIAQLCIRHCWWGIWLRQVCDGWWCSVPVQLAGSYHRQLWGLSGHEGDCGISIGRLGLFVRDSYPALQEACIQ